MYLSTDTKDYLHPELHINIIKTGLNGRLTWSDSMIYSLGQIESEYVLLTMDDFFITGTVNTEIIESACRVLDDHKNIVCINLSHSGPRQLEDSFNSEFALVNQYSKYKVSTHPALWRKSYLLQLIVPQENAWMFEIFGTKRSHLSDDVFLRTKSIQHPPFETIWETGIIKGKWNKEVVTLFDKEKIVVNYDIRSFYSVENTFKNRFNTLKKLSSNPASIVYYLMVVPIFVMFKKLFMPSRLRTN